MGPKIRQEVEEGHEDEKDFERYLDLRFGPI
jgi:hypothetical protein